MTYSLALRFAGATGVGCYLGIAAGRHATAASAIPYGLATAAAVALVGCGYVLHSNGRPRRQ